MQKLILSKIKLNWRENMMIRQDRSHSSATIASRRISNQISTVEKGGESTIEVKEMSEIE